MFYVRPMIWTTPLAFLLTGVAICALRPLAGRTGVAVAATAVLAVALRSTAKLYPPAPEVADAAGFVEPLRSFVPGADALVVAPEPFAWQLRYAMRELPPARPWLGLAFGDRPDRLAAWYPVAEVRRADLLPRLQPFRRAWLVRELRPLFAPAPGDGFERTLADLDGWGARAGTWRSGNLELIRFERPAAAVPGGGR
jgi:hypothetical protein